MLDKITSKYFIKHFIFLFLLQPFKKLIQRNIKLFLKYHISVFLPTSKSDNPTTKDSSHFQFLLLSHKAYRSSNGLCSSFSVHFL